MVHIIEKFFRTPRTVSYTIRTAILPSEENNHDDFDIIEFVALDKEAFGDDCWTYEEFIDRISKPQSNAFVAESKVCKIDLIHQLI